MPRFPGFIGGSATGQSVISDAERTVNLYVEKAQSEAAQNPSSLYPAPGFQAWGHVADVGSRGFLFVTGRMFGVIGGGFYEFDQNGTATKRGAVAVDANPAQIVFNGVLGGQLAIASGGNLYYYVLATNVLTQILAGEATMVAFAAGFGLAFNKNNGKVRLSNLNDFSVWNAGTFFQRSLFGDPWQAMFVDANNLIWLPGTDSFEVWYNTGAGTQPWAPLSGLVGRYGIASSFAFGQSGAGNFWLARNPEGIGQVILTRGSIPQAVSTYVVNTAIAGYLRTSRIDDAEVLVYQQEGHTFPVISFPSAAASWAYDAEGQNWAERGQWDAMHGRYGLWAPRVHCQAFGKHLVGDRSTGTVWNMDTAFATEIDGTGIRRLRRAPHLNHEHARLAIDQLELLCDVGLGLASGQGSDPRMMLRISTDGGRTWSNERTCGVGRLGEYRKRVFWTRLGAPMDAVFELSYSEPVPLRIVDAYLNNKELSNQQGAAA